MSLGPIPRAAPWTTTSRHRSTAASSSRSEAEAIVADPSFRGTEIGRILGETARRHGLELSWHVGFELDAAEVPAEFRGPAIPVIAQRIAREFGGGSSRLHAELIGRAARSVVTDPDRWRDWDTPAETLQRIKQLWHVLVQFGVESNHLGHNSSQSEP